MGTKIWRKVLGPNYTLPSPPARWEKTGLSKIILTILPLVPARWGKFLCENSANTHAPSASLALEGPVKSQSYDMP